MTPIPACTVSDVRIRDSPGWYYFYSFPLIASLGGLWHTKYSTDGISGLSYPIDNNMLLWSQRDHMCDVTVSPLTVYHVMFWLVHCPYMCMEYKIAFIFVTPMMIILQNLVTVIHLQIGSEHKLNWFFHFNLIK